MSLTTWLRDLRGRLRDVRRPRPRPTQRPRRPRSQLSVETLEGRLVPSAVQTVVYVETNDPTAGHNAILAYRSNPVDGHVTLVGTYLTGGTGKSNVGDGVVGPNDSDQEVLLSRDHRFLFAVNAGSGTVAVFRVHGDGSLDLVQGAPFASGGIQPVSLGQAGDDLYVVNQGDQQPGQTVGGTRPNYTGFHIKNNGRLEPIPNSTVEIDPGSNPSQALITPDNKFLFDANVFAVKLDPAPPLPSFIPPYASVLRGYS